MSAMRRKNRELRCSSQSAKNHGAVSIAHGTVAFIEKSVFLPGPFASAESPEDREAHPKVDGKSVFDSTL